ncbi:hypothetical protein GUITHDRAFT_161875 [Guillardia theta CCMP2712]|uniref:PUL domain-containing protein n=1 Tax=Guillardia theta (strain CCMP2712) TaxID=905079 RepID=L1JPZ0_GUITC|nr:hypothetical protein GUITHDRAFT_161875 [Guillardia theta CCMP2712]EKX50143.1 hypothetical protein GUITHDRAFT_161875 [Guillardia theta CCMP2712]|eukprot:XP_005837123.1 hypothetical protein GUITHDRAFT_161875 [Guillardia theta CCMP2712]
MCNLFLHSETRALLQLHVGTAAAVFEDTGAESNKLVQMAHSSLLNNFAVLFNGLQINDEVLEKFLKTSCSIMKAFSEESDVQSMYRLSAAIGTFIHNNATRVSMAGKLRLENLVRDRVLGLDAVRGGLGQTGDPKTQQCCYKLLEQFDLVRFLAPGMKHPESDDEFEQPWTPETSEAPA